MQTITINIENQDITQKVLWFLNHLKDDGLSIVSQKEISNFNKKKKRKFGILNDVLIIPENFDDEDDEINNMFYGESL